MLSMMRDWVAVDEVVDPRARRMMEARLERCSEEPKCLREIVSWTPTNSLGEYALEQG